MATDSIELQNKLDKLGSLQQQLQSMSTDGFSVSEEAMDSFYKAMPAISKLLPVKLSKSPDALMLVVDKINSAVDAGVLPEDLRCYPPQKDMDVYELVGKVEAIAQDKALARDFKEFTASAQSTPQVEPMTDEANATPDIDSRKQRLMKLI